MIANDMQKNLKRGGYDINPEIVARAFSEAFTGKPGKLVDVADTIRGFKGLCEGEYDHLPEPAFYMVGSIEEAIENAKKMAAEA